MTTGGANRSVDMPTIDEFAKDPCFDTDLLRLFDFDVGQYWEQVCAVRERRVALTTAVIGEEFEPATGIAEARYDGRQDERPSCLFGAQRWAGNTLWRCCQRHGQRLRQSELPGPKN